MAESVTENPIVVYSTVWCPDCKRAKKFFGEQRIPYVNIDIEQAPEGRSLGPRYRAICPNWPLL